MNLILFLLVINPINQKLVFRPSFLPSPEIESLIVCIEDMKSLNKTIEVKGKDMAFTEVCRLEREKEHLAKYIPVLQREFERQRGFLKENGLLFAISRIDATENEVMQCLKNIEKAIENKDFINLSSLLEYALPSQPLIKPEPTLRLPEQRQRIDPVKETKGGLRSGPPLPEDTMATIDARITPEIDSLAKELNYDPRKIYEYVRNNIYYEPYYGSVKGSLGAIYEMCGNDIDQASLLIALLRASGIPCRYVRGVIRLTADEAANWLGVISVTKIMPILIYSGIPFTANAIGDSLISIDIEQVWVKAYVPIIHYMGIPTGDQRGKSWLQFFPAIKKLKITEGLNLPRAMNFDFEEFFKDFIVKNPQAKPPIDFYRDELVEYLEQNYPNKTYEDVLMKQEIIEERFSTLPLTPNITILYTTDEFAEVPPDLRHYLTLNLKQTFTNALYLTHTTPMPTIFSRRFTIDYTGATPEDDSIINVYGGIMQTPPYLIDLKPVIRIGGAPVATGSAIGVGLSEFITAIFIFKEPYSQLSVTHNIYRGLTVGVGLFQRPTARLLSQPPAESLDTDRLSAIHLYNTMAEYYVKVLKDQDEIDRSLQIRTSYYYTCGIVTSYVEQWYVGTPLANKWYGLMIDAFLSVLLPTPIQGDYGLKESMLLSGMDGSYWENQIFENRYEAEAISSSKAFRVAHQDTVSIYKVTSAGITPFVPVDTIKAGKSATKSSPPSRSTPPVNVPKKEVEDEIIVKFKSKTEQRKMKEELNKILPGNELLKTSARTNSVLIKIPKSQNLKSTITNLQSSPLIEYAEPNYRYSIQSIAPNDPFFENQWGLRKCLINAAWDSIVGDSTLVIGVLDSGVDTLHPDLKNRIILGYDFVNEDSFPVDDNGHGTQVCGVIGAEANNGIGIAGCDWRARLLILKVIDAQGMGNAFDIAEAIYYAVNHNARVINMSFGSYDYSSTIANAVQYAYNSNCVLVAAAGNDKTSLPFYPAAYPSVIGVSATKENDLIADFSNFGDYIDFASPGVGIYTTNKGGGIIIVSGTSYSCGFVSGAVSLILARDSTLTNQQVYDKLKAGAELTGKRGQDPQYGWGRINPYYSIFGYPGVLLQIIGHPVNDYYNLPGNKIGIPEAGDSMQVELWVYNYGDSNATNVSAVLGCLSPYVTVVEPYVTFPIEGIPGHHLCPSLDYFKVYFHEDMPKGSIIPFNVVISSNQGSFVDGFNIREGDLLSVLELSEMDKYAINYMLNMGCRVIVPSRYLKYDDSTGQWSDYADGYDSEGRSVYFGIDPLDNGVWAGGGVQWCFEVLSWNSLTPLKQWPPQWQYLFRHGYEVAITPEILEPSDSMVYHKGDTIEFRVEWTMTYGTGQVQWIEEYKINSGDYPPGMHSFKAEGWDNQGPVYDSVTLCIFEFYIRENLVKRYFNPLKPDSARIVYQLLPMDYADPDVPPDPIKMEVEIRDCDSNIVYGPTELPDIAKKTQVFWWNGKDNTGRYTDPEKSPYLVSITLTYRGAKGDRARDVKIYTKTTNAPNFFDVPILTRLDPILEIPHDTTRYMEIEFGNTRPLYFSTVILTKEDDTGVPQNDYHCYHPNPYPGQRAIICDSAWNNQPIEFTVERWNELLWGKLYPIRWCEVRPKIYDDDRDRVGYADSTVLGNWTGPLTGFGWGWGENQKNMSEGTLRYRVHIENRDLLGNLLQEATTPRGTDLFRVSIKGNYINDIVQWASSYLGVPYVLKVVGGYNPETGGTYPEPYGRNIYYDPPWNDRTIKTKIAKYRKLGYEGLDCSGLAGWSYIWVGEDLDNNPATVDSVDIDNTGADLLETYYGKVDLTQQDAQDGDMWFIDGNEDGIITHVGIYVKIGNQNGIIHASSEAVPEEGDKVVKRTFQESQEKDGIDWLGSWAGDVEGQAGLGRIPHNQQ